MKKAGEKNAADIYSREKSGNKSPTFERGITGMDIEELAASAGIAKGMFYIVIGIVGLAIPAAMIGGITVLMGKIF